MFSNTIGSDNTATGNAALGFNTTGASALFFNTSGIGNTAYGLQALFSNDTGNFNTATGSLALSSNTSGDVNVATGQQALYHNTTNAFNAALGASALFTNTAGNNNVACGFNALSNNTGSGNIALGSGADNALTTGNSNIDIGNVGVAGESNTLRIGFSQFDTFIAGISGTTVPGGVAVVVGADGHLGTMVSSARFKEKIKPMDEESEAVLALKPVTFCYKKELDPDGIPQFGLVAEDVEKANPDLVARDAKGAVYSVRYEAMNAMLLNEFLKEHRKNEEQEVTIASLQKQVKALTAGLQKVSARIEASKPVPQVVNNP